MNAINSNDPSRQAVLNFSAHLGKLAAELARPDSPLGLLVPPPSLPPRLSAVLSHFHRRARGRKEGYLDLRRAELNAP